MGEDNVVRAVDETPLYFDTSEEKEWDVIEVKPQESGVDAPEPAAVLTTDQPTIDLATPIHLTMLVFPGGKYEMSEIGDGEMVTVPGPVAIHRKVFGSQGPGAQPLVDCKECFPSPSASCRRDADYPTNSGFEPIKSCR